MIVQPGLVYGPGDTSNVRTALIQYLQRKLPMIPRQTAFCWGYVDDIARRAHPGDGARQAGRELYHRRPDLTPLRTRWIWPSRSPAYRHRACASPPGLLKAMAAIMGVVERAVPVPADYSAEYLRINAGVTYIGDNAKARRELGYNPRSLKEGLTETLYHEMRLLGMQIPAAS